MNIEELLKNRVFQKGIDYSLDRLSRFLEKHGSFHHQLPPTIHIAGTNGKGSTLTFITSLLCEAGFKVGSYVSPHLIRYNERFCCNQKPISDDRLLALYEEATALEGQDTLTEFEILTVMGFLYFSKQNLDFLVLETGLGGRHDATNVVTPKVSVITKIGIDHIDFLGPTLTHIATEKAGIIKDTIPVITVPQTPEVHRVLEEAAAKKHAPLQVVAPLEEIPTDLKLTGSYQKENIPLALKAVEIVAGKLSDPVIKRGLQNAQILGRFNRIATPEGTLILDGAHNGIGLESLVKSLQEHFPNQKPVIVFGILKSKSLEDMTPFLNNPNYTLYYCDFEPGRSHTHDTVAAHFTQPILRYALEKPLPTAPLLVVTGSLYFLGDILKKSPHPSLREWYNKEAFH